MRSLASAVVGVLRLPACGLIAPCTAGLLAAAVGLSANASGAPAVAAHAPRVSDTRTFTLVQTVTLHDVPASAKVVRFWVPIPSDAPWQRVLDRRVAEAPEGWQLVRQPESRGELVYVETTGAAVRDGVARVVVELTVERDSPAVDVNASGAAISSDDQVQSSLFAESLRRDAPFMSVTPTVQQMADAACGGENDVRRKVVRLVHAVGDVADHYSKDPSKPHCGRGAAEDCMKNGGGCCTDLHSLFVAMARSQGIPTRIQFGYRLNPAREGVEYDPTYRCWVETWLAGSGWVSTDVVVADGADAKDRDKHVGHLDANRVWLWEGRGFNLAPKQSAPPIETMFGGWAEIDGVAIDPIPGTDGTPSQLRRVIRFERVADDQP